MRMIFSKNIGTWKGLQAGSEYLKKLEHDLEIFKLAKALNLEGSSLLNSENLIEMLTDDLDEITARQAISKDLMENDDFYKELLSIHIKMGGLYSIATDVSGTMGKDVNNYIIIMKWMEIYVSTLLDLDSVFKKYKDKFNSLHFSKLQTQISEMTNSREFNSLIANSKDMKMENIALKSAKLGVNLNEYLEPVSICCLDVNSNYYYPRKVIGSNNNAAKHHGISKFIYKPRGKNTQAGLRYDESQPEVALINTNKLQRLVSCEVDIEFINALNHYFNDLNFNSRTLIRNFIRERINFILEIYSDLGFFLGSVSFAKKLSEGGLDVCLPEVSHEDKKEYSVIGLYNCLLFSESGMNGREIVSNDIELSYPNTFAVLNGPNRGGKTTIVQAVALSMILFQLGIYVPCKKASMKPADIILTHYQREDDGAIKGRLAMEAESMRFILENASHNSFVILNEPFVSTSPSEGMILILNSLYGIRELGCRGIIVTHFHSLNKGIEEDNSESDYKIKFFHMGIEKDGEKRTFTLENGQGKPVSYAMDIMAEYAPGLIDI